MKVKERNPEIQKESPLASNDSSPQQSRQQSDLSQDVQARRRPCTPFLLVLLLLSPLIRFPSLGCRCRRLLLPPDRVGHCPSHSTATHRSIGRTQTLCSSGLEAGRAPRPAPSSLLPLGFGDNDDDGKSSSTSTRPRSTRIGCSLCLSIPHHLGPPSPLPFFPLFSLFLPSLPTSVLFLFFRSNTSPSTLLQRSRTTGRRRSPHLFLPRPDPAPPPPVPPAETHSHPHEQVGEARP